jgi:hypothetical protein
VISLKEYDLVLRLLPNCLDKPLQLADKDKLVVVKDKLVGLVLRLSVTRELISKLNLCVDHYYRRPRMDPVLDCKMILSIYKQHLIFTKFTL